MFWSSVDLTGNQTRYVIKTILHVFWSSVDLTGNQTGGGCPVGDVVFWSSVDLTGNQTHVRTERTPTCFGAVSI